MTIDRDKHSTRRSHDTLSSQEGAIARAEASKLRQQVADQAELISRLRADKDRGNVREDGGGAGAWGSRRQHGRDERDGVSGDAVRLSEAIEAAEMAASVAQEEADDLRQRLVESERELQRMERRVAAAAGSGDTAAATALRSSNAAESSNVGGCEVGALSGGRLLEQENRRLKEENEKLSRELQAFDLEFFEEIEDLKYKYSEAARKLRHYEERSSR